jgi:hypothetical protein
MAKSLRSKDKKKFRARKRNAWAYDLVSSRPRFGPDKLFAAMALPHRRKRSVSGSRATN